MIDLGRALNTLSVVESRTKERELDGLSNLRKEKDLRDRYRFPLGLVVQRLAPASGQTRHHTMRRHFITEAWSYCSSSLHLSWT